MNVVGAIERILLAPAESAKAALPCHLSSTSRALMAVDATDRSDLYIYYAHAVAMHVVCNETMSRTEELVSSCAKRHASLLIKRSV